MLIFRDENDHQILKFDTEERMEKVISYNCINFPDKKHFYTKVYDENDQLIDEFEHKELGDRVYFYKGYISNKK
jgi:hypothetical protein